MKKRIVLLTQYFPPETGAPQTRLFELALGLQQRGWEVAVLSSMPNYPHGKIHKEYRAKFFHTESIQGIRVYRYWLYASNAPRALPRVVSMLSFSLMVLFALPRLWRFRPDYLLVESPPLTLACSAWLLCLLSKPRMIFNVSDLWPRTAKELGAIADGWFYRFLERLESFLYRHAFACTGQSEEIVAYIRERNARQVLLFRNGVDVSRFPIGKNVSSERKQPDKQTLKLVYTGLLGVAQGIENVCRNLDFKKLGVEFHIYGAGAERSSLEDYLSKAPNNNIYYHGSVKSAEIPILLQQYDAALISLVKHIHGAVPSKIYEAMAAGLPIFFSGEGEGARIIKQHKVGWVNAPDDFSQLAKNIRLFKAQKGGDLAFAQNSRQTAMRYFSRGAQIEKLDKFLNDNLERH